MKFSTILALLPLAIAAPTPANVPRDGTPIPGQYIVKLRSSGGQDLQLLLSTVFKMLEKDVAHTYNFSGFLGFAAPMSDSVVKLIRSLAIVSIV